MDSLAETDEDILTFDIPELGGRAKANIKHQSSHGRNALTHDITVHGHNGSSAARRRPVSPLPA